MKKVLSVLLALCLLIGCLPLAASAEEVSIPTSTDEYTYDDSTKTLTIHKESEDEYKGISADYAGPGNAPWQMAQWPFETLVLKEGITKIGREAVSGCTALETIQLPSTLTTIGERAFAGCTSLAAVQFPSGLTTIDWEAFSGCTALTSVTLPAGLNMLAPEAFDECTNLAEINVAAENTTYKSVEGVVLSKDGTELVMYPTAKSGAYTLPASVTTIGDNAFLGSALASITIPATVTNVGNGAFSYCEHLTSVTLANGITGFASREIFSGCTSLASVTLSNTLTTIGSAWFSNCIALTSITLPNSLKELGGGCFSGCTGLTSITLPANLEKLHGGVFMGTKITSIHIPAKTELFHNWWSGLYGPFYDCDTLATVTVDENNPNYKVVNGVLFSKDEKNLVYYPAGKTETSYTIPDGVVSIGVEVDTKVQSNHHSRENIANTHLTSLTVPESVTEPGGIGFENSTSLNTVYGVAGSAIDTRVQSYNGYAERKVTFKNIPAKPVMQISPNKEKLTVSWSAPAADNVTGYTITINGDQFSDSKTLGAVTSYTFEGLTDGTEYTLTLTATNANGSSYTATATGTPNTPSAAPSGGSSEGSDDPAVTENPDGSQTVTETAPDGTVTATTTWEDGGKAVAVKTPEGEKTITVTTASGEKAAEVKLPAQPAEGKKFDDVQSGWYKDAVDQATGYGLFNGTSDTTFSPDDGMTRGMLATVLYNLSGKPEYGTDEKIFTDVASDIWYEDPVDWAYKTGVTSGTSDTEFSPDQDITREQLVTMLYRYAEKIGAASSNRKAISGFPDGNKVAGYAKDAMQWAVAEGFISGRANGGTNYIAPQGTATRAEVAAVLTRFVEYLKK